MSIKVIVAKDQTKPKLDILDVVLRKDWKDKCPLCQKEVKEIWSSPDGTVKAFKCVKGHMKSGVRSYPVWLVRT